VLLKDFLDPAHPLSHLAGVVDWAKFEQQFGKFYAEEMGRPALATRLIGLHYLKYLYNVSDEAAGPQISDPATISASMKLLAQV